MFWLLFLVCVTGLSQLTEAQVVREGKCPKVRPFRWRDPTRVRIHLIGREDWNVE